MQTPIFNTPAGLGITDRKDFVYPPHIALLDRLLVDVAAGKTKRLIINMPPRHGKSELISKYFPAWYLMKFPDKRIILSSYNSSFAATWGRKSREILANYSKFAGISLDNRSNASDRYDIAGRLGGLTTAGVHGGITGKGADLLIIDDPHKDGQEALSHTTREGVWSWFQGTVSTRLEDDNSAIVIIQTRWHYDDLTGKILSETPDDWIQVSLPAIATENGDILGRKIGDCLWDKFNKKALDRIKKQMGSYWFSAEYQQNPIASEFQIFKPENWNYHNGVDLNNGMVIQSWDTAIKDKQTNDYSVCTTWFVNESGHYLVDLFREKVLYPQLKIQCQLLYNKFKPNVVLIEDTASGSALIQDIAFATNMPMKAIRPINDKIFRAQMILPLVENKKVFIPINSSYSHDFVKECSEFPNSAHDDIVDSMTQAINYTIKNLNVNFDNVIIRQSAKNKLINKFSNY